ncbi:hypothetical protein KX928_17585 [Roseobacter sp. YSTF-M11]|uniref:Nuclease n=1 Tax=Roseobacter insulae TaxID=2859783 RepID=A0A9X1K4D2_9RHOB|nr:hypothetical protein [Roseobacter insulae]MBW4709602.1 hypothetical protein [Roseobacter insulae]
MIPALLLVALFDVSDPLVVVDGDTVKNRERGRMRIEGIDAPAPDWRAECLPEKLLGVQSKRRMEELVSAGVEIEFLGRFDNFNRPLIHLRLPDGRRVGHVLVEEGLAVPWAGERKDWCKS